MLMLIVTVTELIMFGFRLLYAVVLNNNNNEYL